MKSTKLQKLIILIMIAAMIVIWPLCLFRKEVANRSGDSGHALTEEMQVGMTVIQRFRAEEMFLKSVEYVLDFDATLPLEGEFLFELLDEEGKVLHSQTKPFNLTPDYAYCDIQINKYVLKNKIYQFRLTNLNIKENVPRLVCSIEEDMHAENNCGMKWNGQDFDGEALTMYTWTAPLDFQKVLVLYGMIGITGCVLYEFAGILSERKNAKEKQES